MSLASKHILMLVISAAFAGAVGVSSSAYVADKMSVTIIASLVSGLVFILQVVMILFVKSEEERELLLIRQIRLKQLEGQINVAEELDRRIQEEIRSGNLQSARDWNEFRRTSR